MVVGNERGGMARLGNKANTMIAEATRASFWLGGSVTLQQAKVVKNNQIECLAACHIAMESRKAAIFSRADSNGPLSFAS